MFYVIYFTSQVFCCTPTTATSLRQDKMLLFVDSNSGGAWWHVESKRYCD